MEDKNKVVGFPCFREHHYTVPQLASLWHLAPSFVRKRLYKRQDLLDLCIVITNKGSRKRTYKRVNIPESVAELLYEEISGRHGRVA